MFYVGSMPVEKDTNGKIVIDSTEALFIDGVPDMQSKFERAVQIVNPPGEQTVTGIEYVMGIVGDVQLIVTIGRIPTRAPHFTTSRIHPEVFEPEGLFQR